MERQPRLAYYHRSNTHLICRFNANASSCAPHEGPCSGRKMRLDEKCYDTGASLRGVTWANPLATVTFSASHRVPARLSVTVNV